jgi:hypothetical protein
LRWLGEVRRMSTIGTLLTILHLPDRLRSGTVPLSGELPVTLSHFLTYAIRDQHADLWRSLATMITCSRDQLPTSGDSV